MQYIKLIKLLYFLDRAALLKWGRPVTTDVRYVSMMNGPVLGRIYDLITGPQDEGGKGIWRAHIAPPKSYLLSMVKDPGSSELSPAEEKMIAAIFKKFGALHWSELCDLSHQFAEWRKPKEGKISPIELEEILKAGDKTDREIAEIVDELESLAVVQRMIIE